MRYYLTVSYSLIEKKISKMSIKREKQLQIERVET